MPCFRARRLAGQSGIALITVLWSLLLLSMIAAGAVREARGAVARARNDLDAQQARLLAEAGIARAVLALTGDAIEAGWRADGTVVAWNFQGRVVRISIRDESGKIDLNKAPPLLLKGLMRAAGAEERRAAALGDAVADYRDKNSLRRLNGAEDEDYFAAGLARGAKDAPFDRIEELRAVFGMTDALFERVKHAVTVRSGQAGIDPRRASREALLALPDVTVENVDNFLARRRAGDFQPSLSDLAIAPASRAAALISTGRAGRVFALRAEAQTEAGSRFTQKTVLRLIRGIRTAVTIEAWEQVR